LERGTLSSLAYQALRSPLTFFDPLNTKLVVLGWWGTRARQIKEEGCRKKEGSALARGGTKERHLLAA